MCFNRTGWRIRETSGEFRFFEVVFFMFFVFFVAYVGTERLRHLFSFRFFASHKFSSTKIKNLNKRI